VHGGHSRVFARPGSGAFAITSSAVDGIAFNLRGAVAVSITERERVSSEVNDGLTRARGDEQVVNCGLVLAL
jgi:hypothetical protein